MDYGQLPDRVIICLDMKSFFCLGFLFHMGIRSVENKACGGKDIKRSGSIVLAATPLLKKEEIKIGSRFFDIPKRKDTHVVNPSMERDIKAVFI
ncbi:hypothetical protein [Priestia aryabhattai]|uniref:hypothetical protein n=1 Tax=Priestia aryabhattai TaxID=412384 RepID=UPI000428CB92|nr:hypothetical protein [Priestia aryabhattai]MCM3251771.1 hypothetical protein [Priestia aryabhattai]